MLQKDLPIRSWYGDHGDQYVIDAAHQYVRHAAALLLGADPCRVKQQHSLLVSIAPRAEDQ
jgi:hypothetical protein